MAADAARAKSLFLNASDLADPAERAAYLYRECGGDAELRARVEALLRADDAAPLSRAPEATIDEANDQPDTEDYTDPTARIGALLAGKYKLVEEIGEGGMGSVFMARQTEPVKRLVAVKLIKPGMDSRQVIARFEAERQALALMEHPNIAKVFDAGTTERGRPYFVMELVKGVAITRYCDEHRLTPRQRLELFIPVCQAVQHAHQKGIIHRDLKPSNVLVASYDGRPVPKVIDFGIAKAAGQSLTEKTLVTGFGAVVGTLEYMSPEQAELNQLDIDTRSDVYSLGVLLYELLTGTTPLGKKRLKVAAMLEVLRLIREEEPPRPSTRLSTTEELPSVAANRGLDPRKLSGQVRGELDWIVMKALEKDRSRRYETANGFAQDVQRYLADEPVLACPPSAWYRFRKFARRNKARLAVAAVLFLAATVMVASVGWAVRDRAERVTEVERSETARRVNLEGQVRDAWNTARSLVAENKLIPARQKLAEARAQMGNDRLALGSLAAEVEAGEAELDRYQQFLDLIDRAHQAELAPTVEPALTADRSRGSASPPASTWGRRPAAAVPLLLQALNCYEVLGRDDWNTALEGGLLGKDQCEQIRGAIYEQLLWLADDVVRRQEEHQSGRWLSSPVAARQALVYVGKAESVRQPTPALFALRVRCRKALGEESAAKADRELADGTRATLAVDHYLRGQAAYDGKQLTAGVQAFEAALRQEPTHYWSMMRLGWCLCDLGRGPEDFAGAARVFTGCILKRPDHAHAYYCRGNAYSKLGRYEDAVADHSRAIELDPKLVNAWNNRGRAYFNLGQMDKAIADHSRAIALDPRDANAWNSRGIAYLQLDQRDQRDKAVADFSKAIELDPKHMVAWANRGTTYLDLGLPDKALPDFSKAIELDPEDAVLWHNRGLAYNRLGQPDKALPDCSKAIELNPKDTLAWSNRAWAFNNLGQPEKAIADCSQAIDLDPKLWPAWNNRGAAYYRLDQHEKAVADFTQAIELDSKHVEPWFGRGLAYHQLAQYDKAVADFSKVVELDAKDVQAWFSRGRAYDQLGQPDKAVANYSQAIELGLDQPQLVMAYLLRARAHGRLAHFEQARTDCQTALKRAPADASVHNELAWQLANCPKAELRDPGRAVELAGKAVELAPNKGSYWNTLGVAHYRAGDWKSAVTALDKSVELNEGGDAYDLSFLAMAHQKLGNRNEARKAYDRAVRWLEENKAALEKDKFHAEDCRRLRSEAEDVLELKKK